jgi:hypothetical protein
VSLAILLLPHLISTYLWQQYSWFFFTLIKNLEFLNLHARQKNLQLSSEKSLISSAWMRALCRQSKGHLPDDGFVKLF